MNWLSNNILLVAGALALGFVLYRFFTYKSNTHKIHIISEYQHPGAKTKGTVEGYKVFKNIQRRK